LLEVTIPFGCIFRDSVLVEVLDAEACGLHIYNAFSPDGDGINDTWSIGGIGQYPDNTVVVFNRWGDILSELQGYNNADVSWDGTSKDGLAVPAGTYYYSMKLTDELKYSGWVFINR
jgi:gliding motility-associated-like protein